jgi:hypothetical protein
MSALSGLIGFAFAAAVILAVILAVLYTIKEFFGFLEDSENLTKITIVILAIIAVLILAGVSLS